MIDHHFCPVLGPVLLTLLRHVARILANGRAAFKLLSHWLKFLRHVAIILANGRAAFKLLSHWLKFLRHVAITLVIQGPGPHFFLGSSDSPNCSRGLIQCGAVITRSIFTQILTKYWVLFVIQPLISSVLVAAVLYII